MNQSSDRTVFIPLMNAKKLYHFPEKAYGVTTMIAPTANMDDVVSAAVGRMRNVRKLKASEENDFEIRRSEGLMKRLREITSELRLE